MSPKSSTDKRGRKVELTTKSPSAAFAERLDETRTDHERLATTTHRLADVCVKLESPRSTVDPGPLITELELGLSRHFAAEEADDYFGMIARERPALIARVTELEAEHVAMLEAAAELAVLAVDRQRSKELVARARRLIAELRAHEKKENRLLQEFVQRDEGGSQD